MTKSVRLAFQRERVFGIFEIPSDNDRAVFSVRGVLESECPRLGTHKKRTTVPGRLAFAD